VAPVALTVEPLMPLFVPATTPTNITSPAVSPITWSAVAEKLVALVVSAPEAKSRSKAPVPEDHAETDAETFEALLGAKEKVPVSEPVAVRV
jgi:hypothetical protein